LAKESGFPKFVETFYVCKSRIMKAKLYDFGLHRHKDEYKTQVLGYRNVVLDKKERLRQILNGGFGRENPAKKLSLIQICDFFCHTVDGSEIPNNHLGCIKS